jgi:hypothetical protein
MNPETFCGAINCHCDRLLILVAENAFLQSGIQRERDEIIEILEKDNTYFHTRDYRNGIKYAIKIIKERNK